MTERWTLAEYRSYLASGGRSLVRGTAPERRASNRREPTAQDAERPVPTEYEEQVRFFAALEVLAARHPELSEELEDVYATSSGGMRHKGAAGRMRESGQRRGVPDIEAWVVREPFHGLAIELKRIKGGRVSPEQGARIRRLRARGYCALVCLGWAQAFPALCRYLGVPVPLDIDHAADLVLARRSAERKLARRTRRAAKRKVGCDA